jgi:uncharacterized protein YbjT (DUF2867 family)
VREPRIEEKGLPTVLITGGAGFIGSHLADELLRGGYGVRILDSLVDQVHGKGRPEYVHSDAELLRGDVRDPTAVRRAFDLVAEKVERLLVLQTLTMPGDEITDTPDDLPITDRERLRDAGWPKLAFIEKRLAGDPTNWWAPNHAAVEAMARSAGLEVVERPGHEIFVCRPKRKGPRAEAAAAHAAAVRAGRPAGEPDREPPAS